MQRSATLACYLNALVALVHTATANTYTGGTTISAGTLQLGNGGTAGSILGNVLNNGTLAINHSNVFAFSRSWTSAGREGSNWVIARNGDIKALHAGAARRQGRRTYRFEREAAQA